MTTEPNIDFIAYTVTKNGRKSHWTRIGVAFAHRDENGFNIVLNAVPVNGEVVLRTPNSDNDDKVE